MPSNHNPFSAKNRRLEPLELMALDAFYRVLIERDAKLRERKSYKRDHKDCGPEIRQTTLDRAEAAYQILCDAGAAGVREEALGRMVGTGHGNGWLVLGAIEHERGPVICEDDTAGPNRVYLVEAIA